MQKITNNFLRGIAGLSSRAVHAAVTGVAETSVRNAERELARASHVDKDLDKQLLLLSAASWRPEREAL